MEETIAGFKQRGRWVDIVEHGERITRALREVGVSGPAFEEWNDWRPKSEERIATVNEKTAEQASVNEGEGERAGKDPDEDLRSAGEHLSESYENLEADDPEAAVDKWEESIDYVARAADSAGRKALRAVEDTVYQNVMTQLAPYYFDNALISANLQRTTRGEVPEFVFEVNINDDDRKEEVSRRLEEYDEAIDRWHVQAEKEVETVEAAEGVEPTDAEVEATTAVPEEGTDEDDGTRDAPDLDHDPDPEAGVEILERVEGVEPTDAEREAIRSGAPDRHRQL